MEPGTATSTSRLGELTEGLRVLCVDDESMIGDLVAHILRRQLKLEVRTARSGAEALRLLDLDRYDLVVVDYVMPEMDGGELYREIERRHPRMRSRFMFITGDTLSESTLGDIASTGRKLLEKPFGLPELVSAIREMLWNRSELREGG